MSKLLPDQLWELIEAYLPEHPPSPKGGRPRASDYDAMRGILFVLKSGIQWQMLPTEAFGVSGSTCWRRLHEWHEAGVWDNVQAALQSGLDYADGIDWERALVDSDSMPAKKGAQIPVPTPSTGEKPERSAMY